jgi:hypothetical protein
MTSVLLAGTAIGGLTVAHMSFASTETPTSPPVDAIVVGATGNVLPDFSSLVTQ